MEENKLNEEEVIVEDVVENASENVAEEVNEDVKEPTKKEKKKLFKSENEKLKEEIIKLQEELGASKNAYFKAYADTENLKKRLQSDTDMIRKYRIQGFLSDVLPVIDNLERAMNAPTDSEELKTHVEGLNMIHQQLMGALAREGVSVIEAKDKPFDPHFHQALMQEKVEDVVSGIVLEEIQKGYVLKDRVVRATFVKVSE